MGIKRIVDTDFWLDEKVLDMFSPEDKLFFLYLMTNPHTTQLGIYQIHKKVMAFEIGYSTEAVSVLIDRFEKDYGLIMYSTRTTELAIKNYLRHSIVKGGKPVEDLLKKEIANVKDKKLLMFVYSELVLHDNLNDTVKSLMSLLNQNDNDNGNDNDNDNDVSSQRYVDESSNESSKTTSKRFTPPTAEQVKAYCDERKNSVDPERFVDFYASKGWMVGKSKMKDWKAAVRNWERSDKEKATNVDEFGEVLPF